MILTILNALAAFFKVAVSFIDYLERQRLIDAGAAQAKLDMMKENADAVRIAISAREAVRADVASKPDSVPDDDPFIRD